MLNNKFIVVGNGVSGTGVMETLKAQNANFFLLSKTQSSMEGITQIKKIDKSFKDCIAIVSPGISRRSKVYKMLKKCGVNLNSELEYFGSKLSGTQIAVTGTNGKTTTTLLIKAMLKTIQSRTFALGNIGESIAKKTLDTLENDFNVIECSSFMLEKIENYKPNVGVFLNFSEDHLNYHKNTKEYFDAKCKMFKKMGENDLVILNFDDEHVREVAKTLKSPYIYFSTKTEIEGGAYIKDNSFYFCSQQVCQVNSTKLLGEHNLSNILASICVAKYFKVSNEQIESAINNFALLPHRLEKIISPLNNVFYNSSKATNIDSALVDINAIDENKIVLIGGSDKGENFCRLFKNELKNVLALVFYGKTKFKLVRCSKKFKSTTLKNVTLLQANNLNEAINIANEVNKRFKASIVLAPACASFDEFKNYEERGEFFKKATQKF